MEWQGIDHAAHSGCGGSLCGRNSTTWHVVCRHVVMFDQCFDELSELGYLLKPVFEGLFELKDICV